MKYWINKESGGDNLIVISDTVFYCSSYSQRKLREFEAELLISQIPKSITGTSFAYIKSIEASSKDSKLKIFYNKEDILKINVKNEGVRNEIITYLKENKLNLAVYQKEQLSMYKSAKRPFLFLALAIGIVFYMYVIAEGIEGGSEYEVHGRSGGQGLGYLMIGLAEVLGVKGVLIIGAIPVFILLYKLVKSIQNPPTIERLIYKRK